MKRMISIIILFGLFLSGCSFMGERMKDPVVFYYVRKDYPKEMGSVFGSEIREAAGHKNELSYLLALYTMGPSSDELRSPLPHGMKIIPITRNKEELVLSLSDSAQNLNDAQLTLACACIARTCMGITDIPTITVIYGEKSVSLNANNLLLFDSSQKWLVEE